MQNFWSVFISFFFAPKTRLWVEPQIKLQLNGKILLKLDPSKVCFYVTAVNRLMCL